MSLALRRGYHLTNQLKQLRLRRDIERDKLYGFASGPGYFKSVSEIEWPLRSAQGRAMIAAQLHDETTYLAIGAITK